MILKHCNYILYADDLQIYYIHFPPCDFGAALERVRENIAAIDRWTLNNSLKFNPSKIKSYS